MGAAPTDAAGPDTHATGGQTDIARPQSPRAPRLRFTPGLRILSEWLQPVQLSFGAVPALLRAHLDSPRVYRQYLRGVGQQAWKLQSARGADRNNRTANINSGVTTTRLHRFTASGGSWRSRRRLCCLAEYRQPGPGWRSTGVSPDPGAESPGHRLTRSSGPSGGRSSRAWRQVSTGDDAGAFCRAASTSSCHAVFPTGNVAGPYHAGPPLSC
mmetsp:Transcript_8382/g.19797  ORF Transcript_8382/g.19797 Transcript_8382/m.19797 type:complete len:213 (-) Transcript_8382:96-734(-)